VEEEKREAAQGEKRSCTKRRYVLRSHGRVMESNAPDKNGGGGVGSGKCSEDCRRKCTGGTGDGDWRGGINTIIDNARQTGTMGGKR